MTTNQIAASGLVAHEKFPELLLRLRALEEEGGAYLAETIFPNFMSSESSCGQAGAAGIAEEVAVYRRKLGITHIHEEGHNSLLDEFVLTNCSYLAQMADQLRTNNNNNLSFATVPDPVFDNPTDLGIVENLLSRWQPPATDFITKQNFLSVAPEQLSTKDNEVEVDESRNNYYLDDDDDEYEEKEPPKKRSKFSSGSKQLKKSRDREQTQTMLTKAQSNFLDLWTLENIGKMAQTRLSEADKKHLAKRTKLSLSTITSWACNRQRKHFDPVVINSERQPRNFIEFSMLAAYNLQFGKFMLPKLPSATSKAKKGGGRKKSRN